MTQQELRDALFRAAWTFANREGAHDPHKSVSATSAFVDQVLFIVRKAVIDERFVDVTGDITDIAYNNAIDDILTMLGQKEERP